MISRPPRVRYEVTSIAQPHYYRRRPSSATQNLLQISRPRIRISRPDPGTRNGRAAGQDARKPRGSFCRNVGPLGVSVPLELRSPKETVSRWEPQDDLSTFSGALRSYLHCATPLLPPSATERNPESCPNFATTNPNFATTTSTTRENPESCPSFATTNPDFATMTSTTRENPEGASVETSALSGFPVPPNPVSKHRTAGPEAGNQLRVPQSAVSHEP